MSDLSKEKKDFELSVYAVGKHPQMQDLNFTKRQDGSYVNLFTQYAWLAWQARAAISTEMHYEGQPDGTITPVDPADTQSSQDCTAIATVYHDAATQYVEVHDWDKLQNGDTLYTVEAVNAKLEEAAKAIEEEISWSDAADDQDELANRVLEQAAAKVRALKEPKS